MEIVEHVPCVFEFCFHIVRIVEFVGIDCGPKIYVLSWVLKYFGSKLQKSYPWIKVSHIIQNDYKFW